MHINIKDFKTGLNITGNYILTSKTEREKKNGEKYLDIILSDQTGNIPCKLWEIPFGAEFLETGRFVQVTLYISEYQGALQGKIDSIVMKAAEDVPDRDMIVPTAPIDTETVYKQITNLFNSFKNGDLKRVGLKALEDKKEDLLKIPAAMRYHQACVGGLLWHVSGLLRIANGFVNIYPDVNAELLYTAVVLHDIGKIDEYKISGIGLVESYSEIGRLQGHLYTGAKYVSELCDELAVDPEIKALLEHMILSHHGKPEWGSAVRPMTVEAYLLHVCDKVDADMFMYNEVLADLKPGEFSTRQINEAYVYRPKI